MKTSLVPQDQTRKTILYLINESTIWNWLEEIPDPELPELSLVDLGMIRKVRVEERAVTITITPTYSGCPALLVLERDIRQKLADHGIRDLTLLTALSPPWTSDWISEKGKIKMREAGIAPPNPTQQVCSVRFFREDEAVACPRCHTYHTRMVSPFGATPCKALYHCDQCNEPFEYFKCH